MGHITQRLTSNYVNYDGADHVVEAAPLEASACVRQGMQIVPMKWSPASMAATNPAAT